MPALQHLTQVLAWRRRTSLPLTTGCWGRFPPWLEWMKWIYNEWDEWNQWDEWNEWTEWNRVERRRESRVKNGAAVSTISRCLVSLGIYDFFLTTTQRKQLLHVSSQAIAPTTILNVHQDYESQCAYRSVAWDAATCACAKRAIAEAASRSHPWLMAWVNAFLYARDFSLCCSFLTLLCITHVIHTYIVSLHSL